MKNRPTFRHHIGDLTLNLHALSLSELKFTLTKLYSYQTSTLFCNKILMHLTQLSRATLPTVYVTGQPSSLTLNLVRKACTLQQCYFSTYMQKKTLVIPNVLLHYKHRLLHQHSGIPSLSTELQRPTVRTFVTGFNMLTKITGYYV